MRRQTTVSYLGRLPIRCSRCGSRDVAVTLHGPG
jgi:hypothetical protein